MVIFIINFIHLIHFNNIQNKKTNKEIGEIFSSLGDKNSQQIMINPNIKLIATGTLRTYFLESKKKFYFLFF